MRRSRLVDNAISRSLVRSYVYSNDGRDGTRTIKVRKGHSGRFYVKTQNDGLTAGANDTIVLRMRVDVARNAAAEGTFRITACPLGGRGGQDPQVSEVGPVNLGVGPARRG